MKPSLLHIVITDLGGAGKAAVNVFNGLKDLGYPSQMITLESRNGQEEGISSVNFLARFKRKFFRFLFKTKKELNGDYQMKGVDESKNLVSSYSITKQLKIKPNFIFVYWISGFLNAKNLYEISEKYNAVIVLSLTDMASFTGGCHFALNCSNYTVNCGSCPGLFSNNILDTSKSNVDFKKKYYDKTKMAVVVGTSALRKQVENSYLLKDKNIFDIKYHVDIDLFSNTNKVSIRSKYGIEENKKVLFFGATQINQKRKGFCYLIESLNNKILFFFDLFV